MDVMFLLMDFLTESDQSTATEVVMFMRELIANYPDLRMSILQRFADSRVLRRCLWLFGEFCEKEALIESVIEGVHAAIRPLPWWPKDPQPHNGRECTGAELLGSRCAAWPLWAHIVERNAVLWNLRDQGRRHEDCGQRSLWRSSPAGCLSEAAFFP